MHRSTLGDTSDGIIFTADGDCIVLELFVGSSPADSKVRLLERSSCMPISSLSGASTAFDAQANYVVLNAAAVNDFFVLVQAPERLRNDAPKEAMLPTVNEEFLRSREERATSRAATDAGKILSLIHI